MGACAVVARLINFGLPVLENIRLRLKKLYCIPQLRIINTLIL